MPVVHCDVRTTSTPGRSLVHFTDPETLDTCRFAAELFADRRCQIRGDTNGRATISLAGDGAEVRLEVEGDDLTVEDHQPWEAVVGTLAVHRLLRLQRHVALMHAAAVGVAGRGLLLIGGKGRGKTTLSLALAARGNPLFGDELAGVRTDTLEIVGLRRAVAVRPGPRALLVDAALRRVDADSVRYPDGSIRLRASIDSLFPRPTAGPMSLGAMVFLRGFASAARLESFAPAREHLRLMTPLASALWHLPRAAKALRLLGVLAKTPTYWLDMADPDATAELIERTVPRAWH